MCKTLSFCLMAPFSHPFGESDRWIEVGRFATTIGPRDFGSISLGELGKFGRSRWGPRFFGQFLLGGDFGQEKWQGPMGFVGFVSILLNIFTPVLGEMIQVDSYCLTGLKHVETTKLVLSFKMFQESFSNFSHKGSTSENLNH